MDLLTNDAVELTWNVTCDVKVSLSLSNNPLVVYMYT